MYTKEYLTSLFVAESERPWYDQVTRIINTIIKGVEISAREGKTRLENYQVMLPDVPCRMLKRELAKKFPDSKVDFLTSETSPLKLFYVDWS